jgi:hypothetical protein
VGLGRGSHRLHRFQQRTKNIITVDDTSATTARRARVDALDDEHVTALRVSETFFATLIVIVPNQLDLLPTVCQHRRYQFPPFCEEVLCHST